MPRAGELCDWLAAVTLPDGGLPFALPVPDPAACAPFWAGADGTASSLQITAVIVATAPGSRRTTPPSPRTPGWPGRRTFCLDAVADLGDAPHAMELAFAVQFLDAVAARHPRAAELLDGLRPARPAGRPAARRRRCGRRVHAAARLRPLPGRPGACAVRPRVVAAELDRLAAGQQADGGWAVDFDSYSPAATLEWRGHRTVQALSLLRANGVL